MSVNHTGVYWAVLFDIWRTPRSFMPRSVVNASSVSKCYLENKSVHKVLKKIKTEHLKLSSASFPLLLILPLPFFSSSSSSSSLFLFGDKVSLCSSVGLELTMQVKLALGTHDCAASVFPVLG